MPRYEPEPIRFMRKVRITDAGCWIWTAALTPLGYGMFALGPEHGHRTILAHRYSYQLHIGPIPEGLAVDHRCQIRACVNPMHLETVTFVENLRRSSTASRRQRRWMDRPPADECKRALTLFD